MDIKQLKEFCENTPLVAHNAKFESKWLLHRGIDPHIVDDTFILASLYDERLPLGLESLCLKFKIDKVFKEEYGLEVMQIQGDRLKERNTRDARNTIKLRDTIKPLLSKEELYVYNTVLLPATKTLAKIELQGICIDRDAVAKLQSELDEKILALGLKEDATVKKFEEITGTAFNISSWVHRGVLIYDLLNYSPLPFSQAKTEEGSPSTQAKVLKKLFQKRETETLDKLIKYTSFVGWKEYYDSMLAFCDKCGRTHWSTIDGRDYVFTNLHLGETTTGRIKSDHPNMQNTPSREGGFTRKVFVPRNPQGLIVECDYDQIELRLIAGLSGDEKLLDEFANGLDPHIEMAKLATGNKKLTVKDKKERDFGKMLNYAIPFGAGAPRVAFEIGCSIGEAQTWLKKYWKEHKTLREWLDNIPESGIVYSPTGMKRHTTTWTQGKNFPIQNSALIALLVALNKLYDFDTEKLGAKVDLCIHDSIRFDLDNKSKLYKLVPQLKEIIEFQAEELYSWLPIPLSVGFKAGRDWGNMLKEEKWGELV